MRHSRVGRKKNRVYTLRIHWRLPFGRKIWGISNIHKPDGKYAFTFILLKIINMGCKK